LEKKRKNLVVGGNKNRLRVREFPCPSQNPKKKLKRGRGERVYPPGGCPNFQNWKQKRKGGSGAPLAERVVKGSLWGGKSRGFDSHRGGERDGGEGKETKSSRESKGKNFLCTDVRRAGQKRLCGRQTGSTKLGDSLRKKNENNRETNY